MMYVDIVHRNARFSGGADNGSREAVYMMFDPLISDNNAFSETLRKNHEATMDPLVPHGSF